MSENTKTERAEVCLVMPPVAFGCMPSLALGILKACLKREGISCRVDYANMAFTHALGIPAFAGIYHGSLHGFLGEYIFNEAAGLRNPYAVEDFVRYQLGDRYNLTEALYLENLLRHAAAVAGEETRKTVDRILERDPKVVGCSAVFEQRNAALAILRGVKARRPDIVTFMGGFACFDRGGIAMLRQFPFLDYVFCGESDDIIAPFCRSILAGEPPDLPYGLLSRDGPFPEEPPHRIVRDLDAVPAPDYEDYLRAFRSWYGVDQVLLTRKRAEMRLILETSRGCWWGEKHACAFCGLNGRTQCFRKKSPARVLQEIREVTEQTGNGHVCFADNILPNEWFRDVLPGLKAMQEAGAGFHFTAEIKPNLREEQVKALREAGYRILQPGIESLSDHVLRLLSKGVSAAQNLALLRYARKYDMIVLWNLLTGTVGETGEDYRLQTELIPSVSHLQPPTNDYGIIYMRNSVYERRREEYGLNLAPDPVFRFISPDDEAYVRDIAFHFVDEGRREDPWIAVERIALRRAADRWRALWAHGQPQARFDLFDDGTALHLVDTRPVAAARNFTLTGLDRALCLAALHPVREESLAARGEDPENARQALRRLYERKILVCLEGRVLTLAVDLTAEKSRELSYRECFSRLLRDPDFRDGLPGPAPGEGKAEALARYGRENGYLFDPETVRRTDLIPPATEMDILF